MSLASKADAASVNASQSDFDHVEAVVRNASSSFYWAMRSLPLEKRRAIFAVYAFCREVDDIADGDAPLAERRSDLEAWRLELDALYANAPNLAITRALIDAKDTLELEQADFVAIIDGMAMDAEAPIRAPDWEHLMLYCDRVACAVGRLCVKIFGEPGENGRLVADALGKALQLTNILRDVREDAELGRIYMPREILEAHGIDSTSPDKVLAHPNLLAAWRNLAGHAAEEFERAERALEDCAPEKMRPARIMMEVYRRNFERMIARAVRDIPKPPAPGSVGHYLHKVEKLFIAARYGLT
jgi:phytoene synthase